MPYDQGKKLARIQRLECLDRTERTAVAVAHDRLDLLAGRRDWLVTVAGGMMEGMGCPRAVLGVRAEQELY